ncbi:hypothetical protein Ancab_027446 [Ancistrocladus abbreviatus]
MLWSSHKIGYFGWKQAIAAVQIYANLPKARLGEKIIQTLLAKASLCSACLSCDNTTIRQVRSMLDSGGRVVRWWRRLKQGPIDVFSLSKNFSLDDSFSSFEF